MLTPEQIAELDAFDAGGARVLGGGAMLRFRAATTAIVA